MHASARLTLQPQVRFGVGSRIIDTACGAVLPCLEGQSQAERALPLPLPCHHR